jgi:glycosyltransferase involved in cell wall biosynthesis
LRNVQQLTLGTVKTLAPKYGIDILLRAFAGLLRDPRVRELPLPCRLLIVGGGEQLGELQALAANLGIAEVTTFTGAVPHADVPSWLNQLDVYAAPSRLDSESFGVAVIEASACGIPVVVSDVGGLPEVVQDGVTGLVVPGDDVGALQVALTRLLLDAALRERLGRQGRLHVSRNYGWGACVDAMEVAYASALAKAHATGRVPLP